MEHGKNTDGKAKEVFCESPRTQKSIETPDLELENWVGLGFPLDPCSVRVSSVAKNLRKSQKISSFVTRISFIRAIRVIRGCLPQIFL
jgi:hypothetical protein